MRGLVDPGSPGRNWNDATALVITNKAAMHFNGDWAKGEFIAAGQTAGKEYGCTLVGEEPEARDRRRRVRLPGDQGQGALATQDKLIEVLLDPTSQLEFNKKKGSIPVRMDVDVSSMDVCAQKSHAVLKDPANQVEAMEMLSHAELPGRHAGCGHAVLEQPEHVGRHLHREGHQRHARRELRTIGSPRRGWGEPSLAGS